MKAIEVDHLTVSYGGPPVIRDVRFDAEYGHVTGLIGPNGGGKSTVVKAVLGLLTADAGTATIQGPTPARHHPSQVAYLPQRTSIDASYPIQVEELVTMGRLPHRGPWRRSSRADRDATREAIERVGLTGLEHRQLGTLSGGQQQRAHLARALAQQPNVYVLDEPFTGIDPPTAQLLICVLRELVRDGAAVLLVNHDLRQVAETCDHLVLLNGSVLAAGPTHKVLASPQILRGYTGPTPTTRDPVR